MSPALAPTLTLPHGAEIPVIGLGTWPLDDAARRPPWRGRSRAATATSTPPTRTATSAASAAGCAPAGVPREEVFVTSKFDARVAQRRRRPGGVPDERRQARHGLPRPVPDPLAEPGRGPLRRRLPRPGAAAGAGPRARDRPLQLQARAHRPRARRDRRRPRREPDRARPAPRPRRGAGVPRGEGHRDGVLQPAGAGPRAAGGAGGRARSPSASAGRRRRSCCAGTCSSG